MAGPGDNVPAVDIHYLLDRLEEVLGAGSHLPLTSRTLVDEQEILDILDQIRVAIPDEITAARKVNQQREQLLADAQEEADRIVRDADQHVSARLSEHALVRAAESRAADIEERALQQAEQMRRETEEYAQRVLQRLHEQVAQVNTTVERGLEELDSRRLRHDLTQQRVTP